MAKATLKVSKEAPKMIIAADNGKKNMKIKYGEIELIYENNLEVKTGDVTLGQNTYEVNYESNDYIVGEGASDKDRREGKAEEEDLLTCLTAISLIVEKEKKKKEKEKKEAELEGRKFEANLDYSRVDIYLAYGESINKYFSKSHIKGLNEKFCKTHTITRDGTRYEISIKGFVVLPEGMGEILLDEEKLDGVFYITDIGGTTMNLLTVQSGAPMERESKSVERGMNFLIPEIHTYLRKKDLKINQRLLREQIKKRNITNPHIAAAVENYVKDRVLKEITNLWLDLGVDFYENLDSQDMIFTGGGSYSFGHWFEDFVNDGAHTYKLTVSDDAIWRNVRGYYEYALECFDEYVD